MEGRIGKHCGGRDKGRRIFRTSLKGIEIGEDRENTSKM